MPEGWVTVALLGKARGIRGEVSAESLTSGIERFRKLEDARLFGSGAPEHGRPVTVDDAWEHAGRAILKFSGIDSMSDAEQIAGMELCVPEQTRPPAPEGEFYRTDVIGCEVRTRDGNLVGTVSGWQDYGGPSLLEVRAVSGKDLLVPFVRSMLVEIDVPGRRVVVDLPEGLTEL